MRKCAAAPLALVVHLCTQPTSAQEFIPTKTPVYKAALSADMKFAAFAEADEIKVVRLDPFTVQHRIPFDRQDKGVVSELRFMPVNNSILAIRYSRFNDLGFISTSNEFLEDSLAIYSVNEEKYIAKVSGNTCIGFGYDTVSLAIAENGFFAYEHQGIVNYGPQGGSKVHLFPGPREYHTAEAVRQLSISPDQQFIALATHTTHGTRNNALEIRRFSDFSLVARRDSFPGRPMDLYFSDDGKMLVLEVSFGIKSTRYFLGAEDLNDVDQLSPVRGFISDSEIVYIDDLKVRCVRLDNGEEQWRLWSNLTELFGFKGVLALNEKEVVVYGDMLNEDMDIFNTSGGIEKVNIEQLSIYASSAQIQDSLRYYDPNRVHIGDNNYNEGRLIVSESGALLYSAAENSFQVWSVGSRRKLREFQFNGRIQVFPDGQDSLVLVIESVVGMGYSDFNLHLINLHTGSSNIVRIDDRNETGFRPRYRCKCFPEPDKTASWICADGSKDFYRIGPALFPAHVLGLSAKDDKQVSYSIDRPSNAEGSDEVLFAVLKKERAVVDSIGRFDGSWSYLYSHDAVASTVGIMSLNMNSLELAHIDSSSLSGDIRFSDGGLFFCPREDEVLVYALEESSLQLKQSIPAVGMTFKEIAANQEYTNLIFNHGKGLTVVQFSHESMKVHSTFQLPSLSRQICALGANVLYATSDGLYTYIPESDINLLWSTKELDFFRSSSLSLDDAGQILVNNSELIDLKTLESRHLLHSGYLAVLLKGDQQGQMLYQEEHRFSVDKPYLEFVVSTHASPDSILWRSKRFPIAVDVFEMLNERVQSPSGRYVVYFASSAFGSNKGIYLVDVATRKVHFIASENTHQVTFSNDEESICLYRTVTRKKKGEGEAYETQFNIFRTEDGKLRSKHSDALDAALMLGDVYVHIDFESIGLSSKDKGGEVSTERYFARESINLATQMKHLPYLIAGSKSGNLFFWQRGISSPVHVIKCGKSEVVQVLESGGKLYVLMRSGQLTVIDFKNEVPFVAINAYFEKKDKGIQTVYATPEGYFKAEKNALRSFHFVKALSAYPMSDYELILNRPDVILTRFGFAEERLIFLYKEAYEKRLKRHGVNGVDDFGQREQAAIRIKDQAGLPLASDQGSLQLSIEVLHLPAPIRRMHVSNNGVPIYGMKGRQAENVEEAQASFTVALHEGLNRISVMIEDQAGVFSNVAFHEVHCTLEQATYVHFLGVGVSAYQDSSMNLHYADTDALELEKFLGRRYKEKSSSLLLLNKDATKEKIIEAKDFLRKSGVNDIVVVLFAGHGLLNPSGDFFFATHDMDFSEPELRGFSFAGIEWLLDSIPARRKLLLMDACHSGEADKEVFDNEELGENQVHGYATRGAVNVTAANTGVGLNNSFRLMQTLFRDLNNSNGAFIISASAGHEYAYEGSATGGVFTHSFLKSFMQLGYVDYGKCELNISNLQKQVNAQVLQLTNGRQTPTSRNENLDWDWSFCR